MAGVEIGVASTKAYVAQLLNLLLYALQLAVLRKTIKPKELEIFFKKLPHCPKK